MKKLLLIMGVAGVSSISAQVLSPQVIASAGNSFSSASARMEYTIGEVVTSTLSGASNTLTQGFQQPEIKILAVENYTDLYTFNLYPNPTEQFVTIESSKEDEMQVHIYDGNGKAIQVSGIFSKKVTMNIELLAAGAYFMVITTKAGAPLHSYTVIKKSNY